MTEDYKKLKSRVDTMEEAVQILKKLALRADERMDDFDNALNNLTVKIEALTDAQIRSEERLKLSEERLTQNEERLVQSEERFTRKLEALASAQVSSEERLAQSEVRLARKFEAIAETHQSLAVKVEAMAVGQAETDRRLRELIGIVRQDRGGGAA